MWLSLGYQILAAAILGVATGLFFGPFCNAIQPIGEIYFMLLQMVALPYICISLIHGLGSMTPALGKKLFKRGWPFWITLWGIIFLMIFALNMMIPHPMFTTIEAGTDESAKLARNFLNYLVPENPLYDLVNNIIPAIAAFGFIFGVALMHLSSKEPVLSFLEKGTQLIEKILHWIALASPIGIFAHLSVVFGTISFEEIHVLGFYVLAFIFAALLITFWILPALLSSLTPLTYKEAIKAFKTVCLLPFVTALPTLALPFIIMYMKKLGKKHHEGDPNFQATSQTVLPICYSFGQIGNCMILFFILFISFYFRHPFTGWEMAVISIFMLPMSVGSSVATYNTVSFLIDQLHFPEQSLLVFKQVTAITMNFQVLISSASILTFIILALYSYYGTLRINWKRLGLHFTAILIVSGTVIAIVKHTVRIEDSLQNKYMDLRITDVIPQPVHAKIYTSPPTPTTVALVDPFDRILSKGILRVGYSPLEMPFSYMNHYGEIAGYDIAYAYQLARDLDCIIEFIPINYDKLDQQIANGEFDIAMSAIIMDESRLRTMNFSQPYEEENIVLIVPVKRAEEFMTLNSVARNNQLKILAFGYFIHAAEHHFPHAHILNLPNGSTSMMPPMLNGQVDAALSTRLQATAWCSNHPSFVPIDYAGQLGQCYFAYPAALEAAHWISFLNNWLILKEQSGFRDKMTRFWLKGENITELTPRWSIIRNVLHWVD